MAQSVAVAELFTAIGSYVTAADGAQHGVVATSNGHVYNLAFKAGQDATQDILVSLDEGIIYGVSGYVSADGTQHVVVATGAGNVYHVSNDGQKQLLGSFEDEIFSAVAAYAGPTTHYAIVATGDGHIQYFTFQGQEVSQQKLQTFDNGIISISGHVIDGTQHILVACGDGNIQHFAITADGQISQHWLCHFAESYIGMTSYITPADGLLHIIPSTRDGKLYRVTLAPERTQQVFVEVHDGNISFRPAETQDVPVDYIRFYELTDSTMMFVSGYVTTSDGIQHILVAASNGSVHHLSFPNWPASIRNSTHEITAQFQPMF